MLSSVDYILTGPAAFRRTGTLAVADQPSISATFQNLAGRHGLRRPVVKGTASMTTLSACKGEAMFDVAAVDERRRPDRAHVLGTRGALGGHQRMPRRAQDSLSVVPAEVYVGSSVQLTAAAHDPDNGPSPLSATWAAPSGTLSNLSTMGATFTCTVPGAFQVGVTITDGTPAARCTDNAQVTVICTPVPSAMLMSAARAGAV